MITVAGTEFYGRREELGGAYIATKFFHLQVIPLVPLSSHLVLRSHGGSHETIPQPFDLRSVVLAYLRWWGPLSAAMAVFAAVLAIWTSDRLALAFVGAALAFGLAMMVALAVGRFGKLSADERAQRYVFSQFFGVPVDVARIGAGREDLAAKLRAALAERVAAIGWASGYRDAADAADGWRSAALDPRVEDPFVLGASLTLARIEASRCGPEERVAAGAVFDRVWARQRDAHLAALAHFEAGTDRQRSRIESLVLGGAVAAVPVLFGAALVARVLGIDPAILEHLLL